jgi:hypothetical protein
LSPLSRAVVRRRLIFACIAGAIATAFLGGSYWLARQRAISTARDRARGEAVRAAGVIDESLKRFQLVVRTAGDDLTSGRTPADGLIDRLRVAIDTTPQMSGIGAAFVPLAHDPNIRLYAPYFQRKGDAVELVQLDSQYDYTQGPTEWYDSALKSGPTWSEPSAERAGAAVVEYSVPFRTGGRQAPAGVIHGTMSLAEINDTVSSLDLGEFGYSFLVAKNGFLISHPFADEYAPERRAQATRAADAERMLRTIPAGTHAIVEDVIDPVTGEPCWLFSEPVPSTGWTVGVVFFKEESSQNRLLRRQEIRFAVALVVTICLILALILEPYRASYDMHTLWTGSALGSVILLIAIGWLWVVGYGAKSANAAPGTVFVDKGSVRRFVIDSTRSALKRSGALPIFVPTGVFIETLEIAGPNSINVTALVWQRYARNIPRTVTRGFLLPDAADRTTTELYRRQDAESETIGWLVKAAIRQSFDYSRYPLDQQDFQLRIWHQDLDGNVVLLPDLDSYKIIHPLARAGLEKTFALPGWVVERTQFSSRPANRTTTFGIDGNGADSSTELSFDVVINRRIIEPMFSNLLPLAVSGFMVFLLLLIVKESTRGNVVQTLSAYASLFFVVILSELDLRRRVSGASILYIEYFYFVMYGMILTSALVTLTNGWPGLFPRVEERQHFLPKLLFWPLMLSTLAVITLCVFY